MPFAREAEATLCNQTRLQNKGNLRLKLFETSSSKSRCLRSCCSLAYVMACDSLRTIARGESPKVEDQPSCRKSAFNEHAMAKRLQMRRPLCEVGHHPCCLLALRNRLATQTLNQKDKRGMSRGSEDGLWCQNIIRYDVLPEYYRILSSDMNRAL